MYDIHMNTSNVILGKFLNKYTVFANMKIFWKLIMVYYQTKQNYNQKQIFMFELGSTIRSHLWLLHEFKLSLVTLSQNHILEQPGSTSCYKEINPRKCNKNKITTGVFLLYKGFKHVIIMGKKLHKYFFSRHLCIWL